MESTLQNPALIAAKTTPKAKTILQIQCRLEHVKEMCLWMRHSDLAGIPVAVWLDGGMRCLPDRLWACSSWPSES